MHKVKIIILYLSKYLGLFFIARMMTSGGLRILCYHGFSLDDEHLFRPKLFMTRSLFKKRLDKISKMKFLVISLDNAVEMSKSKIPFSNSLVITIDDGWQGVGDIAWPLLKQHEFKWTLYLTTYYAEKQTQVMNVAIQYLCWKTLKKELDLSDTNIVFKDAIEFHGLQKVSLLEPKLQKFSAKIMTCEDRQIFLHTVASALEINQDDIEKKRLFYLLNMTAIKDMHDDGVDIELHTHRHSLGQGDKNKLDFEIAENKESIQKICGHRLDHFCYPSGFYTKNHPHWLSALGIISATTCKPGLNYSTTPLLELRRFLDGENITAIEFESELSGFSELLRKFK